MLMIKVKQLLKLDTHYHIFVTLLMFKIKTQVYYKQLVMLFVI